MKLHRIAVGETMPNQPQPQLRTIASVVTGGSPAAILMVSCSSGTDPSSSMPTQSTVSTHTPSAATYASTSFVTPFDVSPPDWLDPEPTTEKANFVTWEAPQVPAVRFLAPESVYRPGKKSDSAVPNDYLSYLLGQASAGAHFPDQTSVTIAGQPATRLTATIDHSLDGSLGCPTKGTLAAACFGLQPGLELRMAILRVNDRPLLIWLGRTRP